MKKTLSLLLAIGLLLGLAACGQKQEEAAEEISPERYEAYARGTTGVYEFASSQNINRIVVLASEDMQAFMKAEAGDQSHMGLEDAEALVVDFFGEGYYHVYIVGGSNQVLYSLSSDGAGEVPAPAPEYEPQKSLPELRQQYAQLSVNCDDYEQGLQTPLPEELLALREEQGDA